MALAFYAQIHLSWLGALANPFLGAFLLGIGSTLLLVVNPARRGLTRESLIGLVFIFASGAALLVADRISQESHDIHSIIFGTAVLVSKGDLYTTLGTGTLTMLLHLVRVPPDVAVYRGGGAAGHARRNPRPPFAQEILADFEKRGFIRPSDTPSATLERTDILSSSTVPCKDWLRLSQTLENW